MKENARDPRAPDLSVVIPTLNEAGNVEVCYRALASSLQGVGWEAVFADSASDDGTSDVLLCLAKEHKNVRALALTRETGLAAACIQAIETCKSDYLAVIDADLQHDIRLLPRMLECCRSGKLDLVVGSRYAAGGSSSAGLGLWRRYFSRGAIGLSRAVLPIPLSDPMSGFFLMRRGFYEDCRPRLSSAGFKILLNLVTAAPGSFAWCELAYEMSPRHAGTSKLSLRAVAGDLALVLRRLSERVDR